MVGLMKRRCDCDACREIVVGRLVGMLVQIPRVHFHEWLLSALRRAREIRAVQGPCGE